MRLLFMLFVAVMLSIIVLALGFVAGVAFAVNFKYKAKKEKPMDTQSEFEKIMNEKYLREQENMLSYTGDEQPEITET